MDHLRLSWHLVADGTESPGPRSRHGLVYDAELKATVLFGGMIWGLRSRCQNDIWALRDGEWQPLNPSRSPPPRHRAAMAYDAVRGHCILFGGQGNSLEFFRDTWILESGQWRQLRSWFWSGPSARCGHAMTFDANAGVVVLFGGINCFDRPLGDTWTFDGSSWKKAKGPGPSKRRYAAFAYHPGLKGCVLHGGAYDDAGQEKYGDTWLFRDGEWNELSENFETTERDDHGLAYLPHAKSMIMLEGLSRPRQPLAFSKTGWAPIVIEPMHPRLQCSPLAYDPTLQGLIMHGGETHHGGGQFAETLVLQVD